MFDPNRDGTGRIGEEYVLQYDATTLHHETEWCGGECRGQTLDTDHTHREFRSRGGILYLRTDL